MPQSIIDHWEELLRKAEEAQPHLNSLHLWDEEELRCLLDDLAECEQIEREAA